MIAKFSLHANGVIYHFSVRHKLGQFVGAIITTFAIEMVAVGIILAFNHFIPKTDLSKNYLVYWDFLL